MNIHTVTFSGASDGNNIQDLADFYSAYPYVEFGIQTPHYGAGRFPSRNWVRELVSTGIRLSAHMCVVRDFIEKADLSPLIDITGIEQFNRIQINTHGSTHVHREGEFGFLWMMENPLFEHLEVIFQLDNNFENTRTYQRSKDAFSNISGLFDTSHGGGLTPEQWPVTRDLGQDDMYGYSGGLGPDNIMTELPKIAEAAGDRDIWIDMENNVMTNGILDLEKCKDVLDGVEASGYLI